jgi:hypothetical protein
LRPEALPKRTHYQFAPALRGLRQNWHEQRAGLDLIADFLISRISASQFALVEPHFHTGSAQRTAYFARRLRVLRRVAQEHRAAGRGRLNAQLRTLKAQGVNLWKWNPISVIGMITLRIER